MNKSSKLDLEKDSPELGEELLKAASGPFTPYTPEDLEAVVKRVCAEKAPLGVVLRRRYLGEHEHR